MTGSINTKISESTDEIIKSIEQATSETNEAIGNAITTFVSFGRDQTNLITR